MSQPAKRNHFAKVKQSLRYQSWWLFVLVLIVIFVDNFVLQTNMAWAKNFICGAVLNFGGQYAMARISFRQKGAIARKDTVNQLYLAEACRWVISIVGFIIIFLLLKPLLAPIVFFGYVIVQISNIFFLWRLR